MDLNRREVLKSGAAGFLLGFLFRGCDGKLTEKSQTAAQSPSAITIRTTPQQAFRPERLVITGTVVGKKMVPETKLVPCYACVEREDDDDYCTVCDDLGNKLVETDKMVERDVTVVPWTIESITISSKEQFTQAGSIPGDMFSATAVDSFVNLDAVQAGQEIEFVVSYTGDKPEGEVFRGALIGTSIGDDGVLRMSVLPISSEKKIVA